MSSTIRLGQEGTSRRSLLPLTPVSIQDQRLFVLEDFHLRAQRGFGSFIHREDMERPGPLNLSDLLSEHGMDVEGVEIYPTRATTPGEFAGVDARCGVIVIWTRVGSQ